ncbi:MAG: hypothetical protein ACLFV4_10860 [Candidatus Hydrogenedentota bacterium]
MNQYTCKECRRELDAWLEGRLDRPSRHATAHVQACEHCYREYEGLLGLAQALERLGDSWLLSAGKVDLRDAVMERVAKGERARPVAPQPTGGKSAPPRYWNWLLPAAAALLALGIWGLTLTLEEETDPPPAAPVITQEPAPEIEEESEVEIAQHDDPSIRPSLTDDMRDLERMRPRLEDAPRHPESEEEPPAPETGEAEELTMEEVLELRRKAITDEEARDQLELWASLSPEEARALAARPDVSAAALVGASKSLSGEEQEQLLLAAAEEYPEDPAVRLSLAQHYAERMDEEPQQAYEQGAIQLAELRELDPGNAVTYYMEAKMLMERGNVEGALSSLETAAELDHASTYSLESAIHQEQALRESGMSPEVARTLTAMTGGSEEYSFLQNVGSELLRYGEQFIDSGNPQAAEQIFNAVLQFGGQIENGANFAREQLAALDLQRTALGNLEDVYQFLDASRELTDLNPQIVSLMEGFENLREFFDAMDRMFHAGVDEEFMLEVADYIMQAGDIELFHHLKDWPGR